MMPPFLAELAALAAVAAGVAYVAQRFAGLVPLVGFLVAGVLIGPHALGMVRDPHLVEGAAEVGVILLLFTIGIEFSLERLARIKRLILFGGSLQVGLTVAVVALALRAAGVGWEAAIFTGFLAALSSTVIVLKLLADRAETGSDRGQASLGILLFQDLAVVLMALLVPTLAGAAGGAAGTAWALAKAALIVLLVVVFARRVMPPFLERIARTCSPDIFLLTVIAACFGTAWLCSLAGLGVSLGAFLAGLVVSESRFSQHAFSEVLPLRILFSAAFFVSIGMLLDPMFLLERPVLVAGVVGAILFIKVLATLTSLRAIGVGLPVAASAGLLLAQVGEFAFVLERSGAALGLYPAGSPEIGGQCFIAATVLLMALTPAWHTLGGRLEAWLARREVAHVIERAEPVPLPPAGDGKPLDRHVVIGGYGDAARRLVRVLGAAEVPHIVLTLNPDGANEAEFEGRPVLRGDYARRAILEAAGIERARVFVIADDEPAMTERVVAVVRALNPEIEILAATSRVDEVRALLAAGADRVIAAEGAADRELAHQVLGSAGVAPDDADLILSGHSPDGPEVRLRAELLASRRCAHTASARPVLPRTPNGCEECLALGERNWVHLRLCMTCGHVGCCDSSPRRHATAHFHATSHPIVRSWQPGEDWAWCYMDETML